MSSTRLIRKVSQFRVQSFYVIPTAHTYIRVCVCVCVCVCVYVCVCATHETNAFHIIFNGYCAHHSPSYRCSIYQLYRLRQCENYL